jgi:gluconate 5-dehydrogenase
LPGEQHAGWLHSQFGLEGRAALVTGGGSGIGEAMARALGLGGARLVIAGRRAAVLAESAARFREDGINTACVACDLTLGEGVEICVNRAFDIAGHIDILVNAAGFNLREPFMQVSGQTWNQHLAIHLTAPFFLTQALAPRMRDEGWGRIINVASLQSSRAFKDSAPYGASKGGIVQLTRAIAEQWSRHNITCNAIAPGFFPTTTTAPIFGDAAQAEEQAAKTMVGRNGTFEDLHGVTVFLASDASSYITGQTIYVDGGYSAK